LTMQDWIGGKIHGSNIVTPQCHGRRRTNSEFPK
jgi:hypothetical protein